MYDKEAGVIACDICDITIEGYGFSIGAGNDEPSGSYCWECACEKLEQLLDESNKEATIVRRSENWLRCCYDLGVI